VTYTILRSRRRTISISVHRDGRVEVHAPMRTAESVIRAFVAQKTPWIEAKLREFTLVRESVQQYEGKLPYLGNWLEIRTGVSRPCIENGVWYLPADDRADALDKLLTDLARAYLVPRTATLAEKYGFSYTGLHITSAKTRFGSCSGKNSLNFTKYLVMYPAACIDYVILHELCHTRHHDHSQTFYRELAKVCPTWKEDRATMRKMPFLGDFVDKG